METHNNPDHDKNQNVNQAKKGDPNSNYAVINRTPVNYNPKPMAHKLANIIYWASIIMLLIGARELISPGTRKPGDTIQIFITLISFEVYMWLLVMLNKWHYGKKMLIDSVRSIVFILAITGFFFMNLNELYLISGRFGMSISCAAFVTCLLKMKLMFKTVNLRMPRYQQAYILGWLILIIIPAPLFKMMSDEARHLNSILYCWVLTIYLTSHVYAIRYQNQAGYQENKKNPYRNWQAPWAVLAIMFIFSVAQCASVIYVFADYSYWYFTPIYTTMAVLAIAMAHTSKRGIGYAWILLGAVLLYMCTSAAGPLLPASYPRSMGAPSDSLVRVYNSVGMEYLINPYLPSLLYGSMVFALCGAVLTAWWMMFAAAVAPSILTSMWTVNYVSKCKNGKGFAMLLGAFLLLGCGIAIQWAQEKFHSKRDPEPYPEIITAEETHKSPLT